MGTNSPHWTSTLLLVAALTGAGRASAQDQAPPRPDPAPQPTSAPEAEETQHDLGWVEARFNYYHNDDNGDGNPFLDEEETVIEPAVVAGVNINDWLSANAQFSYDVVSSASIRRLRDYPMTEQSGASADNYIGVVLGMNAKPTAEVDLGGHFSYSKEYDYESFGFGADGSWSLNEENTTLSLGINTFFDEVRIIRFNGSEGGKDNRTSLTVNLGFYQILTPTLHMSAGYTVTHQSGFLETAFNAVVLEDASDAPNPYLVDSARGVEISEELPDVRTRHAVYARARKYFTTGTSVEVGARLYGDDWGILSEALELRLYQWVIDERLSVRLRYRIYNQSAADAYSEHFYVPPSARTSFIATQDRTQDADLGAFSSHTVGVKVVWHHAWDAPDSFFNALAVDASFDYVLRSDGIDQLIAGLGLRVEF